MEEVEFVVRRHVDVPLDRAHVEEMPRRIEVYTAPTIERHVANLYGVRRCAGAETKLPKRLRGVKQSGVRICPRLRAPRRFGDVIDPGTAASADEGRAEITPGI